MFFNTRRPHCHLIHNQAALVDHTFVELARRTDELREWAVSVEVSGVRPIYFLAVITMSTFATRIRLLCFKYLPIGGQDNSSGYGRILGGVIGLPGRRYFGRPTQSSLD